MSGALSFRSALANTTRARPQNLSPRASIAPAAPGVYLYIVVIARNSLLMLRVVLVSSVPIVLIIRRASIARSWKMSAIEVVDNPFSLLGEIGRVEVKRKDAEFEVSGISNAIPFCTETIMPGRNPTCSCPKGVAPRSTMTTEPAACFMRAVCVTNGKSRRSRQRPTSRALLVVGYLAARVGCSV